MNQMTQDIQGLEKLADTMQSHIKIIREQINQKKREREDFRLTKNIQSSHGTKKPDLYQE